MWAQSAAEIGKIIATARRQRGLTQTELARALGAAQNWISEIERGKERAHIGKVLRVLSFLGVRLEVGEAPWLTVSGRKRSASGGIPLDEIVAAHSRPPHAKKSSR